LQRAALIGYYGRGNLGDELMLICLNQWLRNQDIELTVIADDAPNVVRQHHLTAVQNYPFLGQFSWVDSLLRGKSLLTLKALFQSDLVLCGGGDVIRDQIGWRTFSFQVEKLIVSILMSKPVYLLNVGLSAPVTAYGRSVLRWLLPRCRGIVVRDARSAQLCRDFGSKSVVLLPDIVRRLPALLPEAQAGPSSSRTAVLVALHGDSNVYRRYAMTGNRIAIFAGMLDLLVEEYGLEIEFFPFQPEQDGGDAAIARKVQQAMRHLHKSQILGWTLDTGEIARRLARCRLVIAMRLHAAVLAATYAVPCILMPYDQKVVEFGKQAGLPYVLRPEMLDRPDLAQQTLRQWMTNLAIPEPLPSDGDWLTFRLNSIMLEESNWT
jgi:polysaccharide pyruvyl transferase CsaB